MATEPQPNTPLDSEALASEIRAVFPVLPMPSAPELRFHRDGCPQCQYLSAYLDERRDQPVDVEMIRYMHQELGCLSARGWAWMLPHFLPHCLTPDAVYTQMETEFLLYNLAPSAEHEEETKVHLSALDADQMRCLLHFVQWMQAHPVWSDYCPAEIARALVFVGALSSEAERQADARRGRSKAKRQAGHKDPSR
jgi:hypothetical protein